MERDDVRVVREVWQAFAAFEFPRDHFAAEVEWQTAADTMEAGVYRGPAAVARMLEGYWESFTEVQIEAEEFVEARGAVVVPWVGRARGRVSGAPVQISETHVYRVREGKVVEVREYRSRQEALDALG